MTLVDAHADTGRDAAIRHPGVPPAAERRSTRSSTSSRTLGAVFRMRRSSGADFTLDQLLRDTSDAVFLADWRAARAGAPVCQAEELALSGASSSRSRRSPRAVPPRSAAPRPSSAAGTPRSTVPARRSAWTRVGDRALSPLATRDAMPHAEVEAAEAEGVRVESARPRSPRAPTRARLRLTCQRMALGIRTADGATRADRRLEFPSSASAVVAAVGQASSRRRREGLRCAPLARGSPVDPVTLATNLAGVFAGGDGVRGRTSRSGRWPRASWPPFRSRSISRAVPSSATRRWSRS